MDKGLTLADIAISKGGTSLLSVSHHITPGEVLTVMGPSGVGKSTLLSFVTGTLAADFCATGRIWLNGADITQTAPHTRRIGILFRMICFSRIFRLARTSLLDCRLAALRRNAGPRLLTRWPRWGLLISLTAIPPPCPGGKRRGLH